VILSGGAGTRLWPLSRRESPKQFLKLLEEPLFEATLRRAGAIPGAGQMVVVTGADHVPSVEEAVNAARADVGVVLIEPRGRNTAPAVIAAALVSDPADVLVVLPSDHLIDDGAAFVAAVGKAADLARSGELVTFGIAPTRAETGYGYIKKGDVVEGGFRVQSFKEKPAAEEAERLFADGAHLWNSGMFVFTAGRIVEEGRRHVPELVEAVSAAMPAERSGRLRIGEGFGEVPSISVDHAIMERTEQAVVVPLDAGWSDIGSWQAVWEHSARDGAGNVVIGDVVTLDVAGSYLRSHSRTVAIAGVEGLVVVETPDVVLIVPIEKSQLVKDLAARSTPGGQPD
jgi:mannose-1-phosphate guanylyltransferase/mannose-6-phosphate isomerase